MKSPHEIVVATLVIGAVGCLSILIGVATPHWGDGQSLSLGSLAFIIALVVIGSLASDAALTVLIVYYVTHIRRDTTHMTMSGVTAGLFLGAALAALIGSSIIATFGKDFAEEAFRVRMYLGYSFALTIAGSILSGMAGALALVHRMALQN